MIQLIFWDGMVLSNSAIHVCKPVKSGYNQSVLP